MSLNPARILGIDKGTLGTGKDADIVIVEPSKEWIVTKENLACKSKNSPFLGKTFRGVVEYTICQGKVAYASSL
jgi:dihydroorotase